MNITTFNTQNRISLHKNIGGQSKLHDNSNSSRNKTSKKKKGFALIATIMIISLLMIIALATMSLSNLEQRTTQRGQYIIQAQAYARMALMIALGDLQRQMGPDSRISAPHGLDGASGGMPHWVAVYDAWQEPNPGEALTPSSRNLNFRGWLVSGASNNTTTKGEMLTVVGSGTLGANPDPNSFVQVPMIEITDKKYNGRMAWWISDESSKAKVNTSSQSTTTAIRSPLLDAQSPPYVGHAAFEELENFQWDTKKRAITLSLPGLELASNQPPRTLGSTIHDLTLHSRGILADVRQGRLKRDLSSLFARGIEELEDMPLYVADGRLNHFQISEDGIITNSNSLAPNSSGADLWGINMEELFLFHNLHREIDWSSGSPRLVNRGTKEEMSEDRFYIYKKPSMEAVHMILSFRAVPDSIPDKYKMQGMLDGMVALSNPNDIPLVWDSNMNVSVDLHSLPYYVKWDIRSSDGSPKHTHSTHTMNTPFFRCNIRNGFTLEAGEAAVFGNSEADDQARVSNLTRGFVPRGGVAINEEDWQNSSGAGTSKGLRAGNLDETDKVQLIRMLKTNSPSFGRVSSGFIQCPLKISNISGPKWNTGEAKLTGGGNSTLVSTLMDQYMLREIRSHQPVTVRQFIDDPLPIMMMTFMSNVERSRSINPSNAVNSRPFQMIEPAITNRVLNTRSLANDFHTKQWLVITDPMNYEFGNDRTLAAGDSGKNLYHGGARELALGGNFNVIKRRTPLVPPLSLGSFENAIACGLHKRFKNLYQVNSGEALSGVGHDATAIAKAIGNSWANPYLPTNLIYDGNSDVSWIANNALWDQWFLSSVVDDQGLASSAWGLDNRSARQQFKDLAEGTRSLRNSRFIYYSQKPLEATLDELFDGEDLKPSAFNNIAKHLLVDGAFNVNSTSEKAWKAFLASVRDQELLIADGSQNEFKHPFGTLGYAVSTETNSTDGDSTDGDWKGMRDLNELEINSLATAIVTEVKERGPFINMADFVNRRPDSSEVSQRAVGALQAAIDKSGLNSRFTTDDRKLTAVDLSPLDGADLPNQEPAPARAVGSAGYLSQAALLTALGSQITVRGDTFTIRAYGDHRDASDNILAKAWCEAVVQRTPQYVDQSDPPEASNGWPTTSDTIQSANTQFGRKFKITLFRWLNSDEI